MQEKTAACGCPQDSIWCPHCGRGSRDGHVLRCHRAAVGEDDWWENRDSKSTARGDSFTWPDRYEDACNAEGPMGDAACSRWKGHSGRHMASLGRGFGCAVIAAWPGRHAPRKADLGVPDA